MSFPNHLPPDHPRPITSTPIVINHHDPNPQQKWNLAFQHGTAGIACFTIARLMLIVPAQNYKNAAIVSGNANELPVNAFEGQGTEVAKVVGEYMLKNIADRALINLTTGTLGFKSQEPISRLATSFLIAPLQIARVREARGEKTPIVNAFKENFTVERCVLLALHETFAALLGEYIYSWGIFDYKGHYAEKFEANVRLSQLAAQVLLTPLEVFAKRVAVSESLGDLWKRECERMQDEAQDCGGWLKYMASVAFWNIPEAIGMVAEKIVYRTIVDNWPIKMNDLE